MSKSETLSDIGADIGFLKSVAEEGRNAPLLGGRIGLMWTAMLVPTLVMHGITAMGKGPLAIQYIGALWMGFGMIGGSLSFILARGLDKRPGSNSVANKVEAVIWPVTALLIFGYAIALSAGAVSGKIPPLFFNSIMPFAFALSAVNLAVLGHLTGKSYLKLCAALSGLAMIACAVLITRPEAYFLAAAGVALTGVLPSLLQMRDERRAG